MLDAAATFDAPLPGVTWFDDERIVSVTVRALTGADEVALAPLLGRLSPLEIGVAVAARCALAVHTAGGRTLDISPQLVASLAVGDREAALLHVQAATFGTQLALIVDCPACSAPLDLGLDVDDLLTKPIDNPQPHVKCGNHTLRRATGADQRAVAATALDDPAAAAAALVQRCVMQGDPATLPTEVAEAALERADPQATCEFALTCVECGAAFPSTLNGGELISRQLTYTATYLAESVHLLAAQYHWSYAEIIALPVTRRRRFAELVSDAAITGMR
jgi:hypothetical protein